MTPARASTGPTHRTPLPPCYSFSLTRAAARTPPLPSPLLAPLPELLSAFRKQAKLVEVLKRQRVHMEAAKTLEFVERDFLEALGAAGQAGRQGQASQ